MTAHNRRARQPASKTRTDEDDEEVQQGEAHGAGCQLGADKLGEDVEQHEGHRVCGGGGGGGGGGGCWVCVKGFGGMHACSLPPSLYTKLTVEHGLPEHEVEHEGLHFELLEHRQH